MLKLRYRNFNSQSVDQLAGIKENQFKEHKLIESGLILNENN